MPVPTLTFHDGRTMPALGYGLWQVPEADTARLVQEAVRLGYRMFDGAAIYGNERGLGEGVRHAEAPRDDLFVTTKVWNDRQGYDSTLRAVEESLERLVLDRLDLVLIHWPAPSRDAYVDTWRALIRLRDEGRVTSIGVSNFQPAHLDRLRDETGEVPVLNQIELHPELPQADLRARHAEMGVVTQSWTPLGHSRTFDAAPVKAVARRLGATPAQAILAWHLALGCAVIPRSTNPARMAENLHAADLSLLPEEVAAIESLGAGHRTGPDPATFA